MLLTDFQMIRPPFESTQEETLEWFAAAHAQAEMTQKKESDSFAKNLREKLWRVGCKPGPIEKRGHVLKDYLHRNWDEMEIFRLKESAAGKDLSARVRIFQAHVDRIFQEFYPEGSFPPDDLIHVTCTGYVSPSGAQKIVSERKWGDQTIVTHAYHMGCYGAVPAIRMGTGFLNSASEKNKTDIVHTEICSLHSNPSLHESDQLVSQSLFADGFIKYSIVRNTDKPHLRIIGIKEEIIPDSTKAMSWNVIEWGFKMGLSKEVPVLITRYLPKYLKRLFSHDYRTALFAIHPGGPKILQHVQDILHLSDDQMRFSFHILKKYGNMSSATIPHIWQMILQDFEVRSGTPIISLGFGPGLTISGAIMEKICGY